MRHFNVPIVLFHVLEPLQMQRKYERQFFDSHALLGFLVAATVVALELVVIAEGLCVAEALEAMCNTSVLAYVHLGKSLAG